MSRNLFILMISFVITQPVLAQDDTEKTDSNFTPEISEESTPKSFEKNKTQAPPKKEEPKYRHQKLVLNGFWFVRDELYYTPIISEARSAQTKATVGVFSPYTFFTSYFEDGQEVEFFDEPQHFLGMDATIGREIPLLGWGNATLNKGKDFFGNAGDFGFGFWAPVKAHILWDLVNESHPIVNIDLGLGLMMKMRWGVLVRIFEKFYRYFNIALRVSFEHESSHLGDELTIFQTERATAGEITHFERINVSKEFIDIGLSFEWDRTVRSDLFQDEEKREQLYTNRLRRKVFILRFGTVPLVTFSSDGNVWENEVFLIERNVDQSGQGRSVVSTGQIQSLPVRFDSWFYLQMERRWYFSVFKKDSKDRLNKSFQYSLYMSLDVRHAHVYDYVSADRGNPNNPDFRQYDFTEPGIMINFVTGSLIPPMDIDKDKFTGFLRGYFGVNPHGQLRSQAYWYFVGLGVGYNVMT